MSAKVTVAILTYNPGEILDKVLKGVTSQQTKQDVEILVIDSGSTDGTLELLDKYPEVRLHQIPNQEFGHGKTRNLAVDLATGEYILFLTHDAVPASKDWLEGMIKPFIESHKVGCVVGKQIPHANAPVTIKREVTIVFESLGPDNEITLSDSNSFMSDTNSAVRKDLHKKIPFRDVEYAEDQALGIDILAAGYLKAYSPFGAVNHSHDYTAREYFRRKFDEYIGLYKATGYKAEVSNREIVVGTIKATILDWVFLAGDKQYSFTDKISNFFRSPVYNIGVRLAIRKAANLKSFKEKQAKYSLEARAKKQKG